MPKDLLAISSFLHEGKYEPFTEQEHAIFVQKITALERYFQFPASKLSFSKRELFELLQRFTDTEKQLLFLDFLEEERRNPEHAKIKYYCMVKFLSCVSLPTEPERQAIRYMLNGLRYPQIPESTPAYDLFVCSPVIPPDVYLFASMGLVTNILKVPKATAQQLSLKEEHYYILPHQENGMPKELFYAPKGYTLQQVSSIVLQDTFYVPLPSNLSIK